MRDLSGRVRQRRPSKSPTLQAHLSPRRGRRVADPTEKAGESNVFLFLYQLVTRRACLVPYLQGGRNLPPAVSAPGSYQRSFTKTRFIFGLFATITALQPFRANPVASGSY